MGAIDGEYALDGRTSTITQGAQGDSAYQVAVDDGFIGTITEWLTGLQGTDGTNGLDGQDGATGQDGANGSDGAAGADGADLTLGDYKTVTANYTVLNTDRFIVGSNEITVTLPTTGTSDPQVFDVTNNGISDITLNAESSAMIHGETTQTITPDSSFTVVFNGTNYIVI